MARVVHEDRGHSTPCWIWPGSLWGGGYGQIRNVEGSRVTHRVTYAAARGPIPDGLVLDHLCRQRACCNPDHLEPVTNHENLLRGENFVAVNAVKTECPRGHPLAEGNLRERVVNGRRKRECLRCNREGALRRYHERVNPVAR